MIGKDADETHPAYFNWDDPRAAARLRRVELPAAEALLVLDEVHKFARWRNLVKGIYDTEKSRRRIVVAGSARLDYYRKGGDSRANRYRYLRLHPFSLREANSTATQKDLDAPHFYQVHLGNRHFESGAVTVLPFRVFCRELGMP